MKKILLLTLMLVFVFASTTLYAAEKYSLGMSNIALKVDYINFTEDAFEDIEIENGVYVGLEGYYAIYPNLYLGLEAGWAGAENDGDIDTDLFGSVNVDVDVTFVPIEANIKYVFELDPNWNIGVGAGVSFSYFQLELNRLDVDEDDWLFGGQIFADVNYKMSKEWFIGINGKYQFTDDLELEFNDQDIKRTQDTSADNWRVGAQIGYMF